jgi:hypothetical protein
MTAMPLATSIYKMLVHLYPPPFRRRFAAEMLSDFEDATGEAWRDGGGLAVMMLWVHLARDLAWSVTGQWLRHGSPLVALLAAAGAAVCGVAVAQLLSQPRQPVSLTPNDADQMALLFLATMVILIATIVIMFTVCFWLMTLRRAGRVRRV